MEEVINYVSEYSRSYFRLLFRQNRWWQVGKLVWYDAGAVEIMDM